MALTHQDLEVLSKPFPATAHKFVQGLPYIHEEIVSIRLDAVDPSWSWEVKKIERRANAGQGGKDVGTVIVHATLTVKGVSRDGVGMAVIQQTNPLPVVTWENGVKKNTGEFYTNEANKAEKAATTDAFKRAFRMFGGGRYLLTIPKKDGKTTISDNTQLDKWLKETYGDIEAMPTFHDDEDIADEPATPANISKLPQTKAWTKKEAEQFSKDWQRKGYSSEDILSMLGVSRLGEWTDSLAAANAFMNLSVQKVAN